MSIPGKKARTDGMAPSSASDGASAAPTPGKRAPTDRLTGPRAAVTDESMTEVIDLLDTAPCREGEETAGPNCVLDLEERMTLLTEIVGRAGDGCHRWMAAISKAHTEALSKHTEGWGVVAETLYGVVVSGLPGIVAGTARLMTKLKLSYAALNMLDKIAEAEKKIEAIVKQASRPARQAVRNAMVSAGDATKAQVIASLQDIPVQWQAAIRREAIGLDDVERIALCASLDEEVLSLEAFEKAVAEAVARFESQVTDVGDSREGGTHAGMIINEWGVSRWAVLSFDKRRRGGVWGRETEPLGTDRYTFLRWIDDDLLPAAMTRQVLNTAPPVIRLGGLGEQLANPDAPELVEWREATTPRFQPQYIEPAAAAGGAS